MMKLLIDEPNKHNVGHSMWKAEENLEWSVNPWNNRLTGKHKKPSNIIEIILQIPSSHK